MFDNKTILITGGTGSFGGAVLRRILKTNIKEIRIFSRDEKKQEDLRLKLKNPKVKFYIGDVRNEQSVADAMPGVHYIFHAAALKQVPSCEFYPMEAVQTNILGAQNVMNAAIQHGVERMILLSTDKAVYPINAMGMSKALMEKTLIAKSRQRGINETVFCGTRYGNVMASRGSVIPLFTTQAKANAPMTITDPGMTRFLMSIDESVDLVFYALKQGQQGDIFVQKSPAATIAVLAEAIKELFNSQSDINIIGTRHGEKLYETLVSREEICKASDLGNYYCIPADNRDLNYAKYYQEGKANISAAEDYTSHNTKRLHKEEVKQLLQSIDYIKQQLDPSLSSVEPDYA